MGSPTVQVVIVTWNKKADVLSLLEQLRSIRYPRSSLSIVVVDNASTDGTGAAILSDYPDVHLISHDENRGGAGGFNAGMRWTLAHRPHTDYLWLLDNDVQVHPDALIEMVRVMEARPQAAICGSRIMDRDRPDRLIELGAFIDYQHGEVRRNEPDDSRLKAPDAVFEVDYVAACSLIARVSSVRKMGLWHEALFIYWDDMEWGERFRSAGYEVLAANASVVYHPAWAERTADRSAVWRTYYRTRNALFFFNNYTRGMKRRALLFKKVRHLLITAKILSRNGFDDTAHAFIAGIEDFFRARYGKKEIVQTDAHRGFSELLEKDPQATLMLYVGDRVSSSRAMRWLPSMLNDFHGISVHCIVPKGTGHQWRRLSFVDRVLTFSRHVDGRFRLADRYRILKFCSQNHWSLFLSSTPSPKMGAIWGKTVVKLDFQTGLALSIGKMNLKTFLPYHFGILTWMPQTLFFPPPKNEIKTM